MLLLLPRLLLLLPLLLLMLLPVVVRRRPEAALSSAYKACGNVDACMDGRARKAGDRLRKPLVTTKLREEVRLCCNLWHA
jgi:hypothetical protein